jgi:hypothetical protein
MIAERAERLVLQRVDAAVELIAAGQVRPARRRRTDAIGAGDRDIEDRGNRPDDGLSPDPLVGSPLARLIDGLCDRR